jgi:hypothetical protein
MVDGVPGHVQDMPELREKDTSSTSAVRLWQQRMSSAANQAKIEHLSNLLVHPQHVDLAAVQPVLQLFMARLQVVFA